MGRQTIPKWMKDALPKQCCNCGSETHLTYHHIVPVEVGGRDVVTNIAVVCAECHGKIHFGDKGVVTHGDLIKKGMAAAKDRGKTYGRKPADYEKVMRLIAEHSTQFNDIDAPGYTMYTEHEIMEMAGVKEVTYAKCKRMLKDAMNAPEWVYDWPKPGMCANMPVYERHIKRLRARQAV